MFNNIQFSKEVDWSAVPVNYQWSGYSANSEEFKTINFLKIETDEHPIYICSAENGVALGDYLSKYIFKQNFIHDMESVFSPGCNYWFFKAWEQALPQYEELDPWVHYVVELLIDSDMIDCIENDDDTYFVLSHLCDYESQLLPTSLIDAAKTVCERELLSFCQRSLEDFGNTAELTALDVGIWAGSIIQHFISTHSEIAVEVVCYSEKADASICCWIYIKSIDGDIQIADIGTIYEGLEESFWENHQEFEEGVAEAESLEENNSDLTHQQALESVFGHFVLSFQVDGKEIALDIDSDADEFMYSLLDSL